MKNLAIKTILVSATLLLSSVSAIAEEEPALEQAPAGYLLSLLDMCESNITAEEEELPNLDSIILTCINQELKDGFYFPITVLPVDEEDA